MPAHRPHPAGSAGCRWLMPAAEMAATSGRWRPPPDPVLARWAWRPRATRALGADPGSVRTALDFTVATLHRRGMAEPSPGIAIVVSELLTNALWHALPGSGDTRPRRPIRLGLLPPGPCVLCAVADPGKTAPAPRTPGSLDETGRGLHLIGALSDQWGYTTPSQTLRVVRALFCPRHRYPSRPGRDRSQNLAGFQNSATGPDLGFYAARSYSLMRPPRTGRRWIRFLNRSAGR